MKTREIAAPLLRTVEEEFEDDPTMIKAATEMIVAGTEMAFGPSLEHQETSECECHVMVHPCGCRWYRCGPHVVAFLSCGLGAASFPMGRRTAYAMIAPTVLN